MQQWQTLLAGYPFKSSNGFSISLVQIYEFAITYLPKQKNSLCLQLQDTKIQTKKINKTRKFVS